MAAPKALPIRPTVVAPIAPELVVPSHQLGAPTGVLSQAFDEALAVDQVLFRLRLEGCQVAKALPAAAPAAAMPSANDPAAYKPKTAVRQHAVALRHEPERQAHDRRGVRCLDEGQGRARGQGQGRRRAPVDTAAGCPVAPAKDDKK